MIESNQVSICTAIMNRPEQIRQTLPLWLELPQVGEIIVVDWSSDTPIAPMLTDDAWRKTRVIRVEGERRWSMPRAMNVAVNRAKGKYVAKFDGDFAPEPEIFNECGNLGAYFYTGDDDVSRGAVGSFIADREKVHAAGGYNELGYGWGALDYDFFRRLRDQGLETKTFDPNMYTSIQHDHRTRNANINDPEWARGEVFERLLLLARTSIRFSYHFNLEICRAFDAATFQHKTAYRLENTAGSVTTIRRIRSVEENLYPFVYYHLAKPAAIAYIKNSNRSIDENASLVNLLDQCIEIVRELDAAYAERQTGSQEN